MPEIGRDDREYWLKLLMRLAIDAHEIGVSLFEEEKVLDIDGSVRKAKKEIYSFEFKVLLNSDNYVLEDGIIKKLDFVILG